MILATHRYRWLISLLALEGCALVVLSIVALQARMHTRTEAVPTWTAAPEINIVQHIPTAHDATRGLLSIVDIDHRGVEGVIESMTLPDTLSTRSVVLIRDDGDGQWTEDDRRIDAKQVRTLLTLPEHERAFTSPDRAELTHMRFFLIAGDDQRYPLITSDIGMSIDHNHPDLHLVRRVRIDRRTFEHLDDVFVDKQTFLHRHPMFRDAGDGVKLSGTVVLTDTVIIPRHLHLRVDPGTTVLLGSGVSIVSYSPVRVVGTPQLPIRFRSHTQDPWGVFAVLHAPEKSTVAWAEFAHGGDAFINGTFMSGMVAFHASPVSVSDSTFRQATGDDGLNIKYVDADITRCTFEDNQFDGLDIDSAASGAVLESTFARNGNDGLDVSWSTLVVEHVSAQNNDDKCISIGERSTVHMAESTIANCPMGIAFKDGSSVVIEDVTLDSNDTAVAGYIKKPIFPAPTLTVLDATFANNAQSHSTADGATIVW